MTFNVTVDEFSGTLEALVELVRNHSLDVLTLDLISIAEQMEAAVVAGTLPQLDLAEQMVLLSDLLRRKSKALLPMDKDEEAKTGDTVSVENMQEDFAKFRELSAYLENLEDKEEQSFTRHVTARIEEDIEIKDFLEAVKLEDLSIALHDVLKRFKDQQEPMQFSEEVEKESFNIQTKIDAIKTMLTQHHKKMEFVQLFSGAHSKLEIIVTFLAMLELIKQKDVKVEQERQFGPIFLLRV